MGRVVRCKAITEPDAWMPNESRPFPYAMIGVTGITNHITLHPRATQSDVQTSIERALKRQVEREARRLQVEVRGPTVRLSGMVRSWQQHDTAVGAAWAAPGVRVVINDLRVGPWDGPAGGTPRWEAPRGGAR